MLSAENEVLYPLHHLVDQLPCVLWSTDLKLRLTTVLGAISWPVDGGREPVIGKTLYDLCGVDASSHPIVLWHLAAIAGQRQSLREQVGQRWYDAVLEPLRDPSGRIIGCAGAAVDITERHRIEESLLRSEERLAAAQRLAHVGSFEWDYKLDAVIWSDEMYRIYGIDPPDFGGTFADFAANIPPEDMAELKVRLFGAVHEKGTHSFDHRIVRRDGQVRILHTVCGSTFDEDGAPVRLVGSCW